MRGLPFSCREDDIFDFFTPLKPSRVEFLRGRDTRPSGECEVDFESQEELDEAMTYDKKFIGNRYIELFLLNNNGNQQDSTPPPNNGNNNHMNGGKNKPLMGNNGNNQAKMGAGRTGTGSNSTGGIPSLFATPSLPLAPVGSGVGPIGGNTSSGMGGMTTAYPHQQMAAVAAGGGGGFGNSNPNGMGDMFMADMAKKMFQNAFAPYQNQMFNQIEPPPQMNQQASHFNNGGGNNQHKFGNRRF